MKKIRLVCIFAIGVNIAMAQQPAGTLRAWGSNLNGELGDGLSGNSPIPQSVQNLTDVVAIANGGDFSVAVKSDGSVWSWGNNSRGQLGVQNILFSRVPVPVPAFGPGSGVIAVAAGGAHSLALKSDGSVFAWGSNSNGQLGNAGAIGVPQTNSVPAQVTGLGSGSGVMAIAAGFAHSLALKSDGSVLAWGLNVSRQLGLGDGNPNQGDKSVPGTVTGLGNGSGVFAIAAGGDFSLALKSDGSVAAWGGNFKGQLGIGASGQNHATPVAVSGLGSGANIMAIAAGESHGMALKFDGSVLAWGSNAAGQLGNGDATFANQPAPISVSGLGNTSGVIAVAAGANFSLALKSDGTEMAWGFNQDGEIGNGAQIGIQAPPVLTPVQVLNLNGAVRIALGPEANHSVAIVQPVAGLSPASLNFADQLAGSTSAPQMITIQNKGQDPLVINSLSVSGASADFKISGPPVPFTIFPGTSMMVNVAFSPTAAFARLATLLIDGNAFDAPQFVALSGNGLAQADISVGLGASTNRLKNGSNLTYTISVENAGPTPASGVVMNDALPAGTAFVSVRTSEGSCVTPAVGNNGAVSCNLGTLNSSGTATITLVVAVSVPGGSTLVNTVSAAAQAQDPNLANNSATVVTQTFGSKK